MYPFWILRNCHGAGRITEHIEGCVSKGALFFASPRGSVRGDSSMKIDLQFYSRIRKHVVARVSNGGTFRLGNAVPGGVAKLNTASFTEECA